jgi:hypothetical protein
MESDDYIKLMKLFGDDGPKFTPYSPKFTPYSPVSMIKTGESVDTINHPSHYTAGGVECWDAMRAARGDEAHVEYCIQTAIKYLYRCGKKGEMLTDARKAEAFLNRAIKILNQEI